MRLPRREVARDAAAKGSFTDISEAVRFVRANPWLWRTLLAAGVSLLLFVGPSQVLLPFVFS